tara:strand:+ start:99 stop:1202 length:1104 start_codon:yes stop_codon:yes gene_type:complete
MSKAAELANLIGNINAGGGGVNRNVIINGAMNVAQKGTSHTGLGGSTGAVYTLDRFHTFDGSTAGRATVTQDSSAPSGFANSLKLACTTADTSIAAGEIFLLSQRIEGQNLQAFAKGTSDAKPFSLSFYAKANASKTYVAELFDVDNSRHVGKTFTVGTDWARHEITFPADTIGAFDDDNARSLDVSIWLHGGSTFTGGTLGTTWQAEDADDRAAGISSFFSSTDNTFFITGVQLEVGQNPTEFEHEPFERTLAKCQRYFFAVGFPDKLATSVNFAIGYYLNSARVDCVIDLPVTLRTTPSVIASSGTNHFDAYMNGSDNFSTFDAINSASANSFTIYRSSEISGTAGDAVLVSKSSSASLTADAEL